MFIPRRWRWCWLKSFFMDSEGMRDEEWLMTGRGVKGGWVAKIRWHNCVLMFYKWMTDLAEQVSRMYPAESTSLRTATMLTTTCLIFAEKFLSAQFGNSCVSLKHLCHYILALRLLSSSGWFWNLIRPRSILNIVEWLPLIINFVRLLDC